MKTDKITILIKIVALEFDKAANIMLQKYNLTVSQYKILKFLYMNNSKDVRQVDIEKFFSLTHPTTIGIIDNLIKKDLIVKQKNPNDSRSNIIMLTTKAIEMKKELFDIGDDLENLITDNLSKKERDTLRDLLRKIIEK